MTHQTPPSPQAVSEPAADVELREAARAVVERWDSPAWKDVLHTAVFINRLRAALTTSQPSPATFDEARERERFEAAWPGIVGADGKAHHNIADYRHWALQGYLAAKRDTSAPAELSALEKLALYGAAMLHWHRGDNPSECGDVDAITCQEEAIRYGVLEGRNVDEPCCDQCVCAPFVGWEVCYFMPADVRAETDRLDAAMQQQKGRP